ncbi:MAG: CRISPR-associated helicase Cas3', partial [Lachnospiraceae bacterium]
IEFSRRIGTYSSAKFELHIKEVLKIENSIFLKEDHFIVHIVPETKRIQSGKTHLGNVTDLCEANCPVDCLKNLVKVTAVFHDAGKMGPDFQQYMEEIKEKGIDAYRRQIDHSSAGGRMIEAIVGNRLVAKMAATAVYSHHGLQDCIDMNTGKTLSEKRGENDIAFKITEERYYQLCDKTILTRWLFQAHQDVQKMYRNITEKIGGCEAEGKYGDMEFFWGMYERLLLSVLIDSDWNDSASFFENVSLPERFSEEQMQAVWEDMIANFENYMKNLNRGSRKSVLDGYRSEISDLCYQAAGEKAHRYLLTVPTGAGKTLSSLRFALHHAKQYRKRHIIYAAPFNVILEQNADEIRKAVGCEEYVLEHHCNVVQEDEEHEHIYRKLTESWNCPIVVTTAVEMLNTLFSGQKSSIRRMHNLCNSVIIFDEVQAFPLCCTDLFHLAVNFLTEFCNTTVVLCSATQPSVSQRKENNVMKCREMAGNMNRYLDAFRRVEIEDKRDMLPGGMNIEQAAEFVLESAENYDSVLVILNTKNAAKMLYEALAKGEKAGSDLYHLSNNMCPEHRNDELEAIKEALQDGRRVICVSTQLIEAGVNFSFGCVIRSLAGLDSLIQAAGRCNRHKEKKKPGKVYIIQMSGEAEKLEHLYEIKRAQVSCARFLDEFNEESERFNGERESQESVRRYYDLFYAGLEEEETKYPVVIEGSVKTNLVELLGKNRLGKEQYRRCHGGKIPELPLNQAFRTAGEKFEAISDDGKISVVIPYNRTAEQLIAKLEKGNMSLPEQRAVLRKLQRFTIGISPWMKEKLKDAVYHVGEADILVLNRDYYDDKTGISDNGACHQ